MRINKNYQYYLQKWCYYENGPDEKYKPDFIAEVMRQGSGKADRVDNRGYYIKWENATGWKCFHYANCCQTATLDCVHDDTIAVDRNKVPVIPFMSTVYISAIGKRKADDAGGEDIRGYDIDVYMGMGYKSVCNAPCSKSSQIVDFLNYLRSQL